MAGIIGIGVGAGVVSALLALALASGSMIALFLFFLAPLPIAIAALGWNHKAGLIAAITAALILGVAVHPRMALALGLSNFLPAWWFSFLALLARPADPPAQGPEWYPAGRVLAWIAGVVAIVTIAGVATISTDYATYVQAFGRLVEMVERFNPDLFSRLPEEERQLARTNLATIVAAVAPPISAALSVLISAGLVVLAARLVLASGRLPRPWPRLPGLVLPKALLPALAATLVGSFLDGFIGLAVRTAFAALVAAYALQGLAVSHALTVGRAGRAAMLSVLYTVCALFGGWPLILVALVGVADALFNFRTRRGLTPPQGT